MQFSKLEITIQIHKINIKKLELLINISASKQFKYAAFRDTPSSLFSVWKYWNILSVVCVYVLCFQSWETTPERIHKPHGSLFSARSKLRRHAPLNKHDIKRHQKRAMRNLSKIQWSETGYIMSDMMKFGIDRIWNAKFFISVV